MITAWHLANVILMFAWFLFGKAFDARYCEDSLVFETFCMILCGCFLVGLTVLASYNKDFLSSIIIF
jgi:hypothetical protein